MLMPVPCVPVPQEVDLLGSLAGLSLEGLYGEMDPGLKVDLSHEDAYRLLAVLKKPL